jgi:hypothetical protein
MARRFDGLGILAVGTLAYGGENSENRIAAYGFRKGDGK